MKSSLLVLAGAWFAASLVAAPAYLTPTGAIRINGAEHVQKLLEGIDRLYTAEHPGTTFDLELKGTSSAMPALTFGVSLIAPMGREVNPIERVPYAKIVGEPPLEIRIARDALDSHSLATSLAVYVNSANPVQQLTPAQIAGLFTTGGKGGDFTRWGQVGATGDWAKQAVHPVGTPEYSGFGDYLQQHLFHGLPLAPSYEFAPETADILRRVSADPAAVGIAASHREGGALKSVALIERYLYVYVRRVPGQPLDPVAKAYVAILLSPRGQALVAGESGGYRPLSAEEAAAENAKLAATDPNPVGEPVPAPAAGSIYVVGNDGMDAMLQKLTRRFAADHPEAHFTMVLKGSSTGLAGLTAGVSAFAPMGREAWPSDLSGFREAFGYLPLDVRIGYDAYTGPKRKSPPGIYVSLKNPLRELTLAQIRRIFTAGAPGGDVTHWGQLGLTGKWAHRAIHLYGPRDEGGFATSLRMTQLGKLPFAAHYEALAKNADIAEAVGADPYGIGLVSFFEGGTAPGIRMLPLARKAGETAALASYDEVKAGKYPLSPELHVYLNRAPGQPVDPVVAAYLGLMLSPEGQAILESEKASDEGYVPLAPDQLEAERAKLR